MNKSILKLKSIQVIFCKMEPEHTILPIKLTEDNLKLIRDFRDSLPPRPDGREHLKLSRWQQSVLDNAEHQLFPTLDYVSSKYNQPRNFNLHLLLAMKDVNTYDEMTIELSKDQSRWIQKEHAKDDLLQCCCSHPITICFVIKGLHGDILCGGDCIEKNNFITKEEINKLTREIKERDMTQSQRDEREEKNRIQKEKRIQEKEKRIQEKERIKEEKRTQELEEERIQKEERLKEYQEKRQKELLREKTNFENSICNECEQPFPNQGKYSICFPCRPKCECGKVVNPPFTKCFTCSQESKKDVCIKCKKLFDGKGKYDKCYYCNKD